MFDKSSNYNFSKVSRRRFKDHPRHYVFSAKFETGGASDDVSPMKTTMYVPGDSFDEARRHAVERLVEMERRGYTQVGKVKWARPKRDFGGKFWGFLVDVVARIGGALLRKD